MKKLTDDQKQEAFFYAEEEASLYDDTVELTQPKYLQLHDTMIELLEYYFDDVDKKRADEVQCCILDAGCGTGMEGLAVLKTFPNIHIVAIDFSQPMLDEFQKKTIHHIGQESFDQRCTFVYADLMGAETNVDRLRSFLPAQYQSSGYRAVITALALHHLTLNEKKQLYRRFYEILEPGGLFLNGDLFSYQSQTLTLYAQQHIENWNIRQFTNPEPQYKNSVGAIADKREYLLKTWLDHLRRFNIPQAIESPRPELKTSKGDGLVSGESDLLYDIGFSEVGCPFQYFQGGILWAKK